MERRIPPLKKTFILALLFLGAAAFGTELPSQLDQLRIQIWADLDPIPVLFGGESAVPPEEEKIPSKTAETSEKDGERSDFDKIFGFAINRTKQIAPFLLSGMIWGWNFEYTPSDKLRHVSEYWDFWEVQEFDFKLNKISYHSPKALEDRLVVWAYCDRTEAQKQNYNRWTSIVHPKIHGVGKAPVEDGFEGIKAACGEAIKLAVREHWRTYIKNKPKEITGRVLLINEPRIYIKEGQYTVDLDFFMETDKIVPYSFF